jgi:5'-deoxynucleotidase YfbR-like HD superfamily hydrolase
MKNPTDSKEILNYVSGFQTKAQGIRRFEGNPYVKGDNIAEHLSRLMRLLICIAPQLKAEFPGEQDLVEKVLVTLHVHDDDEVIDGFDIPTALKVHNEKDGKEIVDFEQSVFALGDVVRDYLVPLFRSFRKKDTLVAKIAKALDNIAGNQLVIEQEIGLVNPDQARFAIEYAEKVRGTSKVVDLLIDAQIQQIVEYRKIALNNLKDLPANAEKLLQIDVLNHVLDKAKINLPLEQL